MRVGTDRSITSNGDQIPHAMETAAYPSQDLAIGKRKHTLLWVFQFVLALVFGAMGTMKLLLG